MGNDLTARRSFSKTGARVPPWRPCASILDDKHRAVLHLRFENVVKTNVASPGKYATSETF